MTSIASAWNWKVVHGIVGRSDNRVKRPVLLIEEDLAFNLYQPPGLKWACLLVPLTAMASFLLFRLDTYFLSVSPFSTLFAHGG